MKYLIKRIDKDNQEVWEFADESETEEIDHGRYKRGGVVYAIVRKTQIDTQRKENEILCRRVNGMEEAIKRWKKKLGLPIVQELDTWADEDHCCENNYMASLEHLRTEYIHRHYEDSGYWVCHKHMILINVNQSEELGQQAFEEVVRLSASLKQDGILPVKIYFCKQGWVCILDWTRPEVYLR